MKIGYIRTSSWLRDNNAPSVSEQERVLKEEGCDKIIIDEEETRDDPRRTKLLKELIQELQTGDWLVVYEGFALGEGLDLMAETYFDIIEKNVKIVFVNLKDDPAKEGKLIELLSATRDDHMKENDGKHLRITGILILIFALVNSVLINLGLMSSTYSVFITVLITIALVVQIVSTYLYVKERRK